MPSLEVGSFLCLGKLGADRSSQGQRHHPSVQAQSVCKTTFLNGFFHVCIPAGSVFPNPHAQVFVWSQVLSFLTRL